jgi:hypothetical protein
VIPHEATASLFRTIFNSSLTNRTVTCMSDSGRGFGLDVGFIDHFNTQLVITLNYSAIAGLHTLQIVVTDTLMFSVLLDVSW